MGGGLGEFALSILCVAAVLAAVVWLIRRRHRVGQLHAIPSTEVSRSHRIGDDANPREFGGDDGGDDDGGADA